MLELWFWTEIFEILAKTEGLGILTVQYGLRQGLVGPHGNNPQHGAHRQKAEQKHLPQHQKRWKPEEEYQVKNYDSQPLTQI